MAEQMQKKSLSVPDTQRHSLLLNKYLGHFCCQNHHKDTCLQQSCDPWCPQTCSPQKAAQSLGRLTAELCAQQGRDTEPWAGAAVLETGYCGQDFMCEPGPGGCWSLLPHGDGWDAAATAVSPFPRAGLSLLSQCPWQEPVIPCVGWLLRASKTALVPYPLLPPHPQKGAVGACAVYSQCATGW